MKQLLILSLFLPAFALGQTNWDEYHFAVQGYPGVLRDSGSMMEDYIVKRDTPRQFSYGTMTLCLLIDTDAERRACGIIIIQKPNSPARFLCLPDATSSKELINQCIRDYQAVFPSYTGGVSDEGLRQLFGLTLAVIKNEN